jgi:hypothetical protein
MCVGIKGMTKVVFLLRSSLNSAEGVFPLPFSSALIKSVVCFLFDLTKGLEVSSDILCCWSRAKDDKWRMFAELLKNRHKATRTSVSTIS